jgi:hypothetical protein
VSQAGGSGFASLAGFVAPAEEVSEKPVLMVKAHRVGAQQRFHTRDEIGARRLDHQVKMIAQE